MEAGLQVFNTSNIIQVDALYKNYRLLSHGFVTITYANSDMNPNTAYVEGIVTVSGAQNPMIALSVNVNIRSWREQVSADTFRFRFTVDALGTTPRPFDAEYYVYDAPPPAPTSTGFGLQVYNPSGQVVYDSVFGYMRVLGVIAQNATFPYIGAGVETSFVYSGYKVAVVACQQAIKILNTDISVGGGGETVPGFEFYSLTPRVSNGNTVVTLDRLVNSQVGSAVAMVTRPQSYLLVIDVSGI
jgi:hypothetical protein